MLHFIASSRNANCYSGKKKMCAVRLYTKRSIIPPTTIACVSARKYEEVAMRERWEKKEIVWKYETAGTGAAARLLLHDWNEMQWKIETQVHVISFRTITIQFLLYSIELSLSSWIAQNGLHSISFIEYALYTKIHTYYTFMCTITPNWIINIHCSTLPVIRELPNVRFIYI